VFVEELAIDVLGGEVASVAAVEEVEHLQARRRDLQPAALEFTRFAHAENHTAVRYNARSNLRVFPMRIIAVFLLAFTVAACVHRIDIQQGNYVTQDLVDRLKPGMTKAEVKGLLGTPLLSDAFHGDRWDYYFSNVAGRRAKEEAKLSVFFKEERLVSFTGAGRPPGESPARSPSETPRPQVPGKQ
jgi:outer membrane protein assembly factor BamE